MKILIRTPNWLGDAVMAIPALEAIGNRWPGAEIAVLAYPAVADLYRGQACTQRLIVYDYRDVHRGVWGRERLARDLRREKFDAAMLLQNAFDAAWLAWRAGIPERIGYARDARSWLLTHAIAVPRQGEVAAHESYYYLELLRRAGWLAKVPIVDRIRLSVADEARQAARRRLVAAGAQESRTWVAFAPGAAYGSAKCWAPDRYAALADQLIANCNADVILFGAPAESGMAARILDGMGGRALNLIGATSTAELPALLAVCQLFVGNDAGTMHVAAAVGLPVVGIFGPTDANATSPATPRFTLVRQAVSCSPCFLRHCPIDHRCMTRVSVDQVFAAARAWMEGAAQQVAPSPRSTQID